MERAQHEKAAARNECSTSCNMKREQQKKGATLK